MELAKQPSGPLSLLHLPNAAKRSVVAMLSKDDRCSLRLACSTTVRAVDEFVQRMDFCTETLMACSWQLNQRFPQLRQLNVRCWVGNGDASMLDAAAARLVQGGAPSVTTLSISGLTARAAVAVIGACPSVEVLSLRGVFPQEWAVVGRPQGEDVFATETIPAICAHMPELTSLTVGCTNTLGDAELVALAGLPKLAVLEAYVEAFGVAGCAALGSMRLSSLTLPSDSMRLAAGAALDLRAMQSLTQLQLGSKCEEDYHGKLDAAFRQQALQLHQALHLPPTLHEAVLQYVPGPPLGQLTALSKLHITRGSVGAAELAHIAAGCPVLSELTLCELALTAACHAAPLTALQTLRVYGTCAADAAVRVATVFPAVYSLDLCCECDLAAGTSLFEGAAALECLDLGRGVGECPSDLVGPGASLAASEVAALPSLPSLRFLRLNAEPEHLHGLASMTALQSLQLVCAVTSEHTLLQGLQTAFTTFVAPKRLKKGFMTFADTFDGDIEATDACGQMSLGLIAGVADAAVMYFANAASLKAVWWEGSYGGTGALSSVGLCGLACSTSIRRITVDDHYFERPAARSLEHTLSLLARNKPELVIEMMD